MWFYLRFSDLGANALTSVPADLFTQTPALQTMFVFGLIFSHPAILFTHSHAAQSAGAQQAGGVAGGSVCGDGGLADRRVAQRQCAGECSRGPFDGRVVAADPVRRLLSSLLGAMTHC